MPLECHWLTQCTLGYHWATKRIPAGYTGTPQEEFSWNCPTLEFHWRNSDHCSLHWRDSDSPHIPRHIQLSRIASMPVWNDKMAGHEAASGQVSVKFSFYLEFTTLECTPILRFKRVSISTSLCACHMSSIIVLCIWGCSKNEISQAQTTLAIPAVNIMGCMLGSYQT